MTNSNRTGRTIVPGAVISGVTGRTVAPGESPAGAPNLDKLLEVVVDGPDPTRPQAFLLVITGNEPGRLHVLDRPEMVIGRSKYADIRISERAMSQQHAKIVLEGDHHKLYDLGSTNGTFVNDAQIDQVPLKVGDVVRTGETVFTYMSSAASDMTGNDQTMAIPPRTGGNPNYSASGSTGGGGGALVLRNRQAPVRPSPLPQVIEAAPYAAPDEDGADMLTMLIRLLGFFRRYWLSIGIFAVLGVGAGVASFKFFKPPEVGKFELSLVPNASDNPVERNRRMNFEFFRSAKQNFSRPSLIHETLVKLGETEVTPQRIREIQRRLSLNQGRANAQNLYAGSFQAPTADAAMEFLGVHLDLYLQNEIEKALKVLLVEVETLQEKLAESEEELNTTEQAILAFKQEHSAGLPDQAQQFYQELIGLGSEKGRAASEVARAAEELRLKRRQLKSETPLIESRIEMARPYEDAISDVKRDLAAARAAGKGPQHPDVVKLKEQKDKLEELRDDVLAKGTSKIKKSKNPVYENRREAVDEAEAGLKIAQAEMGRLTNDIKRSEKIVEDLPRLQQEYSELTRSYEATQRVHANLFEKLTSSKIQLDMERASASARFDIITPPNVEHTSRLKTVVMRAGILGFLGFAFGIALGLLRDLRRLVSVRLARQRN